MVWLLDRWEALILDVCRGGHDRHYVMTVWGSYPVKKWDHIPRILKGILVAPRRPAIAVQEAFRNSRNSLAPHGFCQSTIVKSVIDIMGIILSHF
jgi:hypothetical protein